MDAEEPGRTSPGGALSRKMSTLARSDTKPELALRRELHRRGFRFRVQMKVPNNRRRTIDIAFTRARLAVYVDGCFWHGCPEHHVPPKANGEWWTWKVERNRARDRDTDAALRDSGWMPLRIWEHEDVDSAASRVEDAYRMLIGARADATSSAPDR
jgi:DNA mismatch endonuclease (patch repair protein)